jgi:Uma2 family endonuclease
VDDVTLAAPPALGPDSNGMLMTPEEFDAVEEFDPAYRYELVHGVLVVNPIPLAGETGPNELLGILLYLDQQRPEGSAVDETLPQQFIRTRTGRRIADRVIWAGLGRAPDRPTDVPTIAVEFVSASARDRRRDYVEKRQEYVGAGVAEYWIIDRFRRVMTVVRPGPGGPVDQVVAETAAYTTPLLPGFEVPLAALMTRADQLAE